MCGALGGLLIAHLTPALMALAPEYLPRRDKLASTAGCCSSHCRLLVQTYAALRPTHPGFQVEDRVVAAFRLPVDRYSFRDDDARRFADQVLSGIRALPAAPRAELATNVPLTVQAILTIDVTPVDGAAAPVHARFRAVSADYLELMEMPITAGRGLRDTDRAGSPTVAVINETAARQLWNTTDVVGRRLRVIESTPARPVTLRDVRGVVNRVDRGVAILDFASMRQAIGWSLAAPRFQATLLTLLTVIGIVLAATGCFAVLMQNVGRRTRELGVRMTLGATARSVAVLILRGALTLAAIGTVLGIGIALAATRLLESALYGVEPTDLSTFMAAVGVVALVITAAALVPARRVARLNPVEALRHL